VTLQETFVRLSEQGNRRQSWLEGLFASHPPSIERVEQNKRTVTELGSGGELGTERYAAQMAQLLKLKPAYDKHDEALAAAQKKDYPTAARLAAEAGKMVPKEGRFQQLLGDIELAQKRHKEALPHYEKAIDLNPNYFGSYLGGGIAQLQLGNKVRAEEWLTKSADLLPTAPAAYHLGNMARERGEPAKAMQYYKAAAGSDSSFGQLATVELVRMELPQNPGNYIAVAGQVAANGRVMVVIENRAPVAVANIQVTPVMIDAAGRILQQGTPVRIAGKLGPKERVASDAGIGVVPQEQLANLRFRVDAAQVAE
jgi:tetratricopeptide (TPR) repeat protein